MSALNKHMPIEALLQILTHNGTITELEALYIQWGEPCPENTLLLLDPLPGDPVWDGNYFNIHPECKCTVFFTVVKNNGCPFENHKDVGPWANRAIQDATAKTRKEEIEEE